MRTGEAFRLHEGAWLRVGAWADDDVAPIPRSRRSPSSCAGCGARPREAWWPRAARRPLALAVLYAGDPAAETLLLLDDVDAALHPRAQDVLRDLELLRVRGEPCGPTHLLADVERAIAPLAQGR